MAEFWITHAGTADDLQVLEGLKLTVVGKGNKQRIVPVPFDAVAASSKYLTSSGLDPDPEHAGNRGMYLLGKSTDVSDRMPFAPRAVFQGNPLLHPWPRGRVSLLGTQPKIGPPNRVAAIATPTKFAGKFWATVKADERSPTRLPRWQQSA